MTQIYFPPPIMIPDSSFHINISPVQYGEEAFMKIIWTNSYHTLSTNYFIELEFDHSNLAWDFNLGWGNTNLIARLNIPCIVEIPGSSYTGKCLIKRGGALNTKSYIQVIGLPTISLGATVNIFLPKIKFGSPSGSNPLANLKFLVYENTPGEDTHKTPIMFITKLFQQTATNTLSSVSFQVLDLVNNKPASSSVLSIEFDSVLNPNVTIYEYNLLKMDTGKISCGAGTSTCYVFSDPVKWIVFEANPLQGTRTITVHR